MTVPVGIALGSNLGDRSAELDAGISFLRELAERGKLAKVAYEPLGSDLHQGNIYVESIPACRLCRRFALSSHTDGGSIRFNCRDRLRSSRASRPKAHDRTLPPRQWQNRLG